MISKEAIQAAFNYFKANAKSINQGISTKEKDYHLHVQDLTGVGMSDDLVLAAFLSLCSSVLEKPIQEQTAILGTMTIGGFINSIDNFPTFCRFPWSILTHSWFRTCSRMMIGLMRLTTEDYRAQSPLFYSHVGPYGTLKLDMSQLLALT